VADDLDNTQPETKGAPMRVPSVLLVAGEGRLSTHPIAGARLVIGRSPECDVTIQHAALSRRHAVVQIGPPLTVQDLGSMNGTRVARELLQAGAPIALALGESFHIGPFSFVVLDERRAAESAGTSVREVLRVEDPTVNGVPAVVRDIAASEASVLVLGETGVGKELLAQTIHNLSGRRGPLQQINCAALAESLVEGELFGHEKGAFTGATQAKEGLLEAAQGGTVFLDEVGELPARLQAKLLRAVEAREVIRIGGARPITIDVRFVAATNRDLGAEVAAGTFRRDLYYRLDGVSLYIPPLRERRGMLVPLALQFIEAGRARKGATNVAVSHQVLARLVAHDWPGNVRELKATIERALLLAGNNELRPSHIVLSKTARAVSSPPVIPSEAVGVADPLHALSTGENDERAAIIAALDACAGNQTRAAQQLGIARSTLTTKLALYRIPRPRPRPRTR
jgi:two-component system response regulator AtoC